MLPSEKAQGKCPLSLRRARKGFAMVRAVCTVQLDGESALPGTGRLG
jgi:hypothetical protein